MSEKKRNLVQYIDALVDDEGLKTDVKVTITEESIWKLVGGLLVAGIGIAFIAQILKRVFQDKHSKEVINILTEIKSKL